VASPRASFLERFANGQLHFNYAISISRRATVAAAVEIFRDPSSLAKVCFLKLLSSDLGAVFRVSLGAGICVDVGHFSDAVAGLRADLDENPLTKGVVSSDQARRGYKAAMDAALGRGSQALTEWIEGFT
jgi:hypothetical protein